jgi:hypothetical protein
MSIANRHRKALPGTSPGRAFPVKYRHKKEPGFRLSSA